MLVNLKSFNYFYYIFSSLSTLFSFYRGVYHSRFIFSFNYVLLFCDHSSPPPSPSPTPSALAARQKMSFLPFKSRQRKTKNSFLSYLMFLSLFKKLFKVNVKGLCCLCCCCLPWVLWLWLWLWTSCETFGKGVWLGLCLSICLQSSTLNELTENGKWTWTNLGWGIQNNIIFDLSESSFWLSMPINRVESYPQAKLLLPLYPDQTLSLCDGVF